MVRGKYMAAIAMPTLSSVGDILMFIGGLKLGSKTLKDSKIIEVGAELSGVGHVHWPSSDSWYSRYCPPAANINTTPTPKPSTTNFLAMPLDRPIPAFYCCYLLRSTVRRSSVYIGSTPHPGEAPPPQLPASRSRRDSPTPWPAQWPRKRGRRQDGQAFAPPVGDGLYCDRLPEPDRRSPVRVSGPQFAWHLLDLDRGTHEYIWHAPILTAARWAWQNPHITQHIPADSRLLRASPRKGPGKAKRPRHGVASLLSNLHLLLRVPSFSRWPLEIRFFSEDVYKAWLDWSHATAEAVRPSIPIIQDFPPPSAGASEGSGSPPAKKRKIDHGIAALEIGYAGQKLHVQKGKEVVEFENEGVCTLCSKDLEHNAGFYAICPTDGCESVTHLTCLGKHFVEDEDSVVPIQGNCPSCKTELRWIDVVKEVTLRLRGQKEVENLLKVKRSRKAVTASRAGVELFDDDPSDDEIQNGIAAELERLREFDPTGSVMGIDGWHDIDDSDDSDPSSIASTTLRTKKAAYNGNKASALRTVIEDSDWDDALAMD